MISSLFIIILFLETLSIKMLFFKQNGVIFVLSGYVNPQRGKIRDRATSMGARYSPAWDIGCTHLM